MSSYIYFLPEVFALKAIKMYFFLVQDEKGNRCQESPSASPRVSLQKTDRKINPASFVLTSHKHSGQPL